MPIIHHQELASKRGYFSKVISRDIVNASVGAEAFTVWEQTIPSDGYISAHYHDIEEALIILSGQLHFSIENKEHILKPNSTVFIPPKALHHAQNLGKEPVHLIAILESSSPKVIYPNGKPSPVDWDAVEGKS